MSIYQDALRFERKVVAIFRLLGAEVKHDVSLAGNQIDILVSEKTPSDTPIHSAVECKYYSKPVGISVVNAFAGLTVLLKNRGLIEKAILVARSGFTRTARDAAKEHGIDLLEIEDLEQKVKGRTEAVEEEEKLVWKIWPAKVVITPDQPKRAFVIMPFAPEFDDVYVLGIREVAEKLGIVVERADVIEHNQSIPELIKDRIERADIIIAETSRHNPNVFYEVGLAHGKNKETILICRDTRTIPFDIATINHLSYSNIVELREKLETRLKAMFNL